jgi:hypothetical protein
MRGPRPDGKLPLAFLRKASLFIRCYRLSGCNGLALASYHKCDFLLTWNGQHLANANKFAHIRRVNTLLGLFTPTLVTPLELLPEERDNAR